MVEQLPAPLPEEDAQGTPCADKSGDKGEDEAAEQPTPRNSGRRRGLTARRGGFWR